MSLPNQKKQKICIIGLGYVGLTLAMHAARNKFEVHGIEILESTYNILASGESHFHEPGINELLNSSMNKNFFLHKCVPDDINFDVFIITVGTPLISGKKIPDMNVLYNAIRSISPFINKKTLLILRSTIPVGTSSRLAKSLKEENNLSSIDISFCPERTAEGNALTELQSLPQIISGNNKQALKKARLFFENLADEVVEVESLEAAELIKLFNNTFRDATFAIANSFNLIAQSFNINGSSVIDKANHNYPRSFIPKPGFVAGPCLEKDAYILSSNMSDSESKNFILGIRRANENLEDRVSAYIKSLFFNFNTVKILFTGLAFKGIPQTNDLRGSSAIKILEKLNKYIDHITIHDFLNTKAQLSSLTKAEAINPEEIFNFVNIKYDYIFILNNDEAYKSLEMQSFIKNQISKGSSIIDCWNVMDLSGQFTLSNIFFNKN